ncbi:hypothetical protein [Sinorhizobium americanum]|nr:hypothetical protein [Sinorhizobium americanum]
MAVTKDQGQLPPSSRNAGMRPTRVTDIGSERILLQVGSSEPVEPFTRLGFEQLDGSERVYVFRAETSAVFAMCQALRDIGVPFSTHRHMGADYQVEYLREKGLLSGVFKRINFFGNDWDGDAPYQIEEF